MCYPGPVNTGDLDGGEAHWLKKINMIFWCKTHRQHVLAGVFVFRVRTVWPLSSDLLPHTASSLGLPTLTYTYVRTVCALACAPLLFLNCDTKCYRPNWGARGMLSPILSLSVPSDALQAREAGPGDFAMCPASIIYDQSTPSAMQNYGTLSVIVKIDQLNALWFC